MKKILSLLFLGLTFNLAHAQIPSAPWTQQMAAEQVINIPGGKSVSSKIYVDNGKVRVEVNAAGMEMINITRMDKQIMYMVMPAQKIVMETPLTPKDSDNMMAYGSKDLKFDSLGEGTTEGVLCDKYRLNYSIGRAMIFWINKATRVPVVMESETGDMKIIWKNVVPGPQPASLFEPPADYKVIAKPVMPTQAPQPEQS